MLSKSEWLWLTIAIITVVIHFLDNLCWWVQVHTMNNLSLSDIQVKNTKVRRKKQ